MSDSSEHMILVRVATHGVSRVCPATDRKKVQEDGQWWSAKLMVKGTLTLIRMLTKRAESDC